MKPVELSILIPVFNEGDTVEELHRRLTEVLAGLGRPYEILFVDDGSTDATAECIAAVIARDRAVRAIHFRRNFGKAAALSAGFRDVRGDIVVTLDGDLQDDPEEIPAFLEALERGYDLVSGWKRRRHDPLTKRWPSRIFNWVTARVTGIRLHDFNCGFKAYRREVVTSIRVYGELHRYIPVLADRLGFRVGEHEVRHHPRRHGRSKYGGARFINGFLDLLTVVFLGSSRHKPLHVFGRVGVALLTVGLAINAYMGWVWIDEGRLHVRPLLIFGVILVILGTQFISMGLLAEMIVSTQREGEVYAIRKRLPPKPGPDGPAASEGEGR
jgi:glycosyltransferase involved in cell wall biosynthesis